ncbi:hypothetical protein [Calorimonas adulescens]|uniref:O-antigen ligase family protein n=1 Tax=Calorimonas adulescens TaxID=2606906 RepID=A0A5D8QF05_9THEO|nr:hypothetical protein [Calorimonas adulescens]TZE83081.1 hypothetical protein FWJ32_01795 [Calorimonas adulescens]
MERFYQFYNKFIFWYILIGSQIVILFTRLFGVWFNNLEGIILILLLCIYLVITLIVKIDMPIINQKVLFFFITNMLMLFISIYYSSFKPSVNFIHYLLMFFGYILIPSIVGILMARSNYDFVNKKTSTIWILISVGTLIVYYYIFNNNMSYIRFGKEANYIAVSRSIAFSMFAGVLFLNSFIQFILYSCFILLISYILATRQVFFGSMFVLAFYSYKRFLNKNIIKISYKLNLWKTIKIMLSSLFMICLLFFIYSQAYSLLSYSSLRFDVFFDSLSLDNGRVYALNYALDIFNKNPLFGYLGYEKDGLWAHNTIVNSLGQFGIIGTLPLIFLVLYNLIKGIKKINVFDNTNCYLLLLALYFIFIGLTVGSSLVDPAFWFILYYIFTKLVYSEANNKNF